VNSIITRLTESIDSSRALEANHSEPFRVTRDCAA
jgi:hypothetical protein